MLHLRHRVLGRNRLCSTNFPRLWLPTRSIEDPLTVALCKMTTTTVICMIGTTTGTTATSTIIMSDTTTPPVISIATATGAATTSIGK